eukprot:SAG22_NODE_581_length_8895_cov_2.587767_4_plen_236_part_00
MRSCSDREGANFDVAELLETLQKMDEDRDGTISLQEFRCWWYKTKSGFYVPPCPEDFIVELADCFAQSCVALAPQDTAVARGQYGRQWAAVLTGSCEVLMRPAAAGLDVHVALDEALRSWLGRARRAPTEQLKQLRKTRCACAGGRAGGRWLQPAGSCSRPLPPTVSLPLECVLTTAEHLSQGPGAPGRGRPLRTADRRGERDRPGAGDGPCCGLPRARVGGRLRAGQGLVGRRG